MSLTLLKHSSISFVILISMAYTNPVFSDDIEELIDLFRIEEDIEAQYRECLDSSTKSVEAELRFELQSERMEIDPGDDDWALLIAIYSEYYTALCDYLSGDNILNFYRAEFRKRFSADEISALIAFHKTPIGKKLNDEWFQINRTYSEVLGERQSVDSYEAQRQFDKRMEDFWDYREEKLNSESREQDA